MYYVRCNTRSSGASAKGTPGQALKYITGAHDAERDPSYSSAELAYIARLDPGWKRDLEGGRIPLVGLGALRGCEDQATLAREFERACQPYHDPRGTTGYLSYTFTMPKELSLVAEGHREQARLAMYAAIQAALDAAFTGKEYGAVTAIHTRNEAGEVHYHAHVLIGKFARDSATGRVYSLNSRGGGNTGKVRLAALKQAWKQALDAELKTRIGLTVTQGAPYARPALTLADGTYVPPLNRESRRVLDKHLCFRISEPTADGAVKTRNFRWTHFDPAIYELASSKRAGGWSTEAFRELFPELVGRLKTYESRVLTLKRAGYLTREGHVTDAFTLHYRVHKGPDHPELQRLRADLHKLTRRARNAPGTGGGGSGPPGGTVDRSPVAADPDVDLWLALHRHQTLIKRLDRLGIPPAEFKRICEEARRSQPTPETLQHLRAEARRQVAVIPAQPALPRTKGVVRAYCSVHRARVISYFVIAKGLLTLRPGIHLALAEKMRARARIDYYRAKDRKLAVVARRLRPIFWIGRILMPNEVHRLELALRRCNRLASRQSAEAYFRDQRARAYRNSRDALVAQLRNEARLAAFEANPRLMQQGQELRRRIADSAATVAAKAPDADAIDRLRTGLEVLRLHRPSEYAHLTPWRGRESELMATVLARTKDDRVSASSKEHGAALLAGRVGYLLAKERTAPATDIPTNLRAHARELVLANARLRAADVEPPFTADVLRALPTAAIGRALAALRESGLLAEGPAWALRAASAPVVTDRVRKQITEDLRREQEMER